MEYSISNKDLVDFIILICLYIFIFYKRWKSKGKDVLFINTTFYVYLVFVIFFTLMPVITSLPFIFNHAYTPMNLTPFVDVTTGRGDYTLQIILNIIMTIPFGFLLPLVSHQKTNFLKTIFFTFLLSLSIELIQPFLNSYRSSDITDLITNVIGGAIGYTLYLPFRPLIQKVLDFLKAH